MGRKLLSRQQLFNLSVFAFGLQFANALQLSNMSSLYKFLGAESGSLPYLWLAAPVSGLIMQPIIGQLSDSTCTRFGRRRPYILGWGILAVSSICLLPLSPNILTAAILLWIIGFSINGSTEALRALIADITLNRQKAKAFAMQTIFSGLGAGAASFAPYIIKNSLTIPGHVFYFNKIPLSLQLTFFVGGMMMFICMLWTIVTIKEKPDIHAALIANIRRIQQKKWLDKIRYIWREVIINIKNLPPVIKKFIPTQVFTWMGIFTMLLYFTLGLAQHVYGLPIQANIVTNDYYVAILEKSTIKAGVYFAVYQCVSVAYAILLPYLARKFSLKFLYAVSLVMGAIGLLVSSNAQSELVLVTCMILIGVMWGSIMTLPYAIVSAELPKSKMGVYLGIFNITITLPQVIAGFILGPIHTKIFNSHAAYTVMLSGALILMGGMIMWYQASRHK